MEETNRDQDIIVKLCNSFKHDSKAVRKNALVGLQNVVSMNDFDREFLRNIFSETHVYTLNGFRDKTEAVRSQATKFMQFFLIEKLPISDYYLSYIFPVLVERLGTAELVEESEEVRLEQLQLVNAIIVKYSRTEQLRPFVNDIIMILRELVKDKYPKIKELSCNCVSNCAQALPKDFHLQAETLIGPVLSNFSYQQYKIRVAAVKCMGDVIMNASYKGVEQVTGPMAERLFDQVPIVRQTVAKVAALWLTQHRDRYSFFPKFLPLILTGLNDEVPETRSLSQELWNEIGLQYQKENEKDLKDELDFLIELPKYYPEGLRRSNLGCRVLVARNVSKIAPALARELSSWQGDVKVRCSQLLCSIAVLAEEKITQHLQELLPSMYTSARDDDQRVVINVAQAARYIGLFVPAETWCKLVIPIVEDSPNFGNLMVLANLIEGCPHEYLQENLEQITGVLANNFVCYSRKPKYQRELIKCTRNVVDKITKKSDELGSNLFKIIVTIYSVRDEQNTDTISLDLLEDLKEKLQMESVYDLWNKYLEDLLANIHENATAWTVVTFERCIFETILLNSGVAFGEHLIPIGNILKECLEIEAEPESRLKSFVALSTALENKDVVFRNAKELDRFLQQLVTDILTPTLVWHAGKTAEAMRTIAASCLCNALTPGKEINLFRNPQEFTEFYERLLPLLLSLTEDASFRSRLFALHGLILLKQTAENNDLWTVQNLTKIYPEILKRFDDPIQSVREAAIQYFGELLKNVPNEFTNETYNSHVNFIVDTLLVHLDDEDTNIQELIFDALKCLVDYKRDQVISRIEKHESSMRNRKRCEDFLESLKI